MKLFKSTLLLTACSFSVLAANTAHAVEQQLPAVELRGGGASSVAEILPRIANCMGNPGAGLNKVGSNDGSLNTVLPGSYVPTAPTAANPAFDCATQEVQPNTETKYISTGSGAGRTMWKTLSTVNLNGTANNINPFTGGAGVPSGWANLQFAFSDSPISAQEKIDYDNNANIIANKAGPAIQFPLFVLPVAVAYNPAYGVKSTGAGPVDLKFNVKVPVSVNGVVSGGLKLSKDVYCKIFNGEITNWNNAALKTLNANLSLHDATNDTLARWTAEGAPIRLVGRVDNSGTTDIFTRALAAQCPGRVTTALKFTKNAQALPYTVGGTIDITRLRTDSSYKPSASQGSFAGSIQSLSGFVYDRVSHQICKWDEVNTTSKQCDASVKGSLTAQTIAANGNGDGLFMVADTSDGVNEAINGGGTNSLIASSTAGISLNGSVGYIGADWVKPSPGRTLFAAALQKGTTTAYVLPSATNATAAFGTTILPPQTTAASGAYNTADTRVLGAVDPSQPIANAPNNGASVPVDRANPLHWTALLYNPNVANTLTLANPAAGYPITGATFLLTYTCFKPANAAVPGNNAKRFGMAELIQLTFGKITKTSTNAAISANTMKGTGAASLGIAPQANIAVPAASWVNAITETFLKKSAQLSGGVKLGDRNLWIQDGNATTPSDVDTVAQTTDQKSNPTCDANFGA
ncbi:MAG TPA: substrate-binding domain-containing protein [Novosphingobium sp.]